MVVVGWWAMAAVGWWVMAAVVWWVMAAVGWWVMAAVGWWVMAAVGCGGAARRGGRGLRARTARASWGEQGLEAVGAAGRGGALWLPHSVGAAGVTAMAARAGVRVLLGACARTGGWALPWGTAQMRGWHRLPAERGSGALGRLPSPGVSASRPPPQHCQFRPLTPGL